MPFQAFGMPFQVVGKRSEVFGMPFQVFGKGSEVVAMPFQAFGMPFQVVGKRSEVVGKPLQVVGKGSEVVGMPFQVLEMPFQVVAMPLQVVGKPSDVVAMPLQVLDLPFRIPGTRSMVLNPERRDPGPPERAVAGPLRSRPSMRSARVLATALSAIALGAGGCGRGAEPGPPRPRGVLVTQPRRQRLQRRMKIPGNVIGYFQATLMAQVAGYVRTVHFDKGDLVRQGDTIAEIDVPEVEADRGMHQARVEEAESNVERTEALLGTARATAKQAEADVEYARALSDLEVKLHERAKQLREGGDISVQDLEIAQGKREAAAAQLALAASKRDAALAEVGRWEAEVRVARSKVDAEAAALRQVDALLGYATIRAPFDGIVTARWLDPGALVQRATRNEVAQPVVSVATRGRVRIQFATPEGEVAFVHSGTEVAVTTEAYPGRTFHARVTRVASMLWTSSRTMLSEAEYENEENLLLPGLYVDVALVLEEHENAVTLPPDALVMRRRAASGQGAERSAEKARVFVLENGIARERAVTKGWEFGDRVEITAGLDGHETVILGAGDLRDGDQVSARFETVRGEDRDGEPKEGGAP